MGDKKRLGVVAMVVSAILSPFIFFSTPLKSWENDNPLLMVWQEVIYPIEYLWHQVATGTTDVWTSYVDLSDAANENLQLKTDLNQLKARYSDYDERLKENKRLRELIGFRGRFENQMVAAEVISIDVNAPFQSLRITRGKSDGLDIGMPVVAADGIVGRIVRIGRNFSDVQLLVDSNFKADALLQRTRVRGVISGSNRSHCTLQLHKRTEIRIGDTIITSGIVGGFPKGLPIGKVMRISYDSEAVAQRITVEPWVDYRRLEEVMVLISPDQELEKIIETAGSDWLRSTIDHAVGG